MELTNRICMAPLTRLRADWGHVHTDLAVTYYSQRASSGSLIISEGTFIAPFAIGFPFVPGCWSAPQIAAWKQIVDAVHAKGGFIFLQLWTLGRAAQLQILGLEPGGPHDLISASDVPMVEGAEVKPRGLTVEEIKEYTEAFAHTAKNFVEIAGGDGVEIHAANGYLLDQFLNSNSNTRTDQYGGSVENRIRFPLEVAQAVVAAVGEKKVSMRLSPWSPFQLERMTAEETQETYGTLVQELKNAHPNLAYLSIIEPRVSCDDDLEGATETSTALCDLWSPGVILSTGGYSAASALKAAEGRENLLIGFGRHFTSTPDLVDRVRRGVDFTPFERAKFYMPGNADPDGYTSYLAESE
ncbi:NADPH2 dehydrogenase [Pseudohyphozyma bogoriensis]|nr:NADPH2 dehydrogenase [Pseudohyphozyma bogoriensis]